MAIFFLLYGIVHFLWATSVAQHLSCSVALIITFNTKGVYNFIPQKANFPVSLVLFYNGASFLFCRFLKSGVANELKNFFLLQNKNVRVIYSKQDKTLLLLKCYFGQHMYGVPLQFNEIRYFKRNGSAGSMIFFSS